MTVIYVVHPEEEEISKVRHILAGRDFQISAFSCGAEAQKHLAVRPPDICLLRLETLIDEEHTFIDVLNETVAECPVIILTDKNNIAEHIRMVGEKSIQDYFILHPVLDPLRLHLIIEKTLSQSALSLNLKDLKTRISDLPGKVPDMFEQQTASLERQISGCLDGFRSRMKTDEFQNIIELVDEKAFDDKFEQFAKVEISKVIKETRTSISELLSQRLTAFTVHIKQQIDSPPDFNNLNELREKLNNPSAYSDSIDDAWGDSTKTSANALSSQSEKRILFMDDEVNPTDGLADILENFGHSVLTAHSPRKLIDLLRNQEIDILICGHNLGNIDGIEVVRRVKEGLDMASLPVILLTGNATPEILDRCHQAGINQVVKIPLIPKTLDEKIKALLR